MLSNTLSTWNKKKLRLVLIFFFSALVIPTTLLITHAFSQLKWEAFHHYRSQAEELTSRIDLRYKELIKLESDRDFSDYAFSQQPSSNKGKPLPLSPLSDYPIKTKFPGVIGYFQIDHNGQFSTPLLPSNNQAKITSSLSNKLGTTDKSNRTSTHNKIYNILSQNKLIIQPIVSKNRNDLKPSVLIKKSQKLDSDDRRLLEDLSSRQEASKAANEIESVQALAPRPVTAKPSDEKSTTSQAAFDELQIQKPYSKSKTAGKTNLYSQRIGRVEDLKLEKKFVTQARKQLKRKQKSSQISSTAKLPPRVSKFISPDSKNSSVGGRFSNDEQTLKTNMFENKTISFEISLLESGHFVLYRKIWKNESRYIQGIILNAEIFIMQVMSEFFYNTNVSNTSNLSIAFQGNILSTLSSQNSQQRYSTNLSSDSNQELKGSLLLQKNLSSTLEKFELVFSVDNLPIGPGGVVLSWLSFIILIILCGGFVILYFLGLKQITLARQQQDFVSAVSHELKTPLTSIRMYGEMLREGWTTEEKRNQYYDYIHDESERLTRLINNVLQLSKMTRNELPVDLKEHGISELVDIIQSKIHSQVERAGFKLNLKCDPHTENTKNNTKLLIDIDYFTQIIINLVDNSIKFSAKSDIKQVDISCVVNRNNSIQFNIRDYGPGISKDQIRKIFNLFYRTENELTRETVGTGIGLSLVKQMIQSMHAKIDVVDKDPGVEFQIIFELA